MACGDYSISLAIPPITRHAAMVMARDCVLMGTKAKNELGYRPRVTVEDGLAALKDETKP